MTLCIELQQSHEMDYENGTHFALEFTQDIWLIRTFTDYICQLSINEIPKYCKIYCYSIHPNDDKAWSLLHCVHRDKAKIFTY